MLSTSFQFRNKIAENSKMLAKAELTFPGGRTQTLTGDDFMLGGMSFADAVSSSGSFDIGAAIINKCDLTLNNYDRRFDDYDFTDVRVVPYIGVELDNDRIEWLRKGTYWIEQPKSYGSTIGLEALDAMAFLERPYSDVLTVYPASLRTIALDICDACGVTLENTDFANHDYSVAERPDDDSLTCLAMMAYVAQASGNWARMNEWGHLALDWYDTSYFESEDWLDGERFDDATPYASGDTADGGNFINYNSGDVVDGGIFTLNQTVNIHSMSSQMIVTDDVVITGLRVKAQDLKREGEDDLEGEVRLFGTDGYVLEISDNPLILYGQARNIAQRVGERVVGMQFRPFDISAIGDPAVEAGDPVIITDNLQNQYVSFITSLTYKLGSYETFCCNAETSSRNRASSYSAQTRAIVQARNAIRREKSARERAIENLATKLSESSGLYMTKQKQQDNSYIYYMHDKPELRESKVIWKLTANAFGISTDGGQTYPYGLDTSGNAILNRIYAIGLDADFITTGALVVNNGNKTVFRADVDTGVVSIDGSCVNIGTEKLVDSINGIRALYGTCATASATAEKAVTCAGFQLRAGAVVNVRFTYKNTANNPKLNVNGTGAKPIYINNQAMTSPYFWNAQDVVTFVYSGSYWYVADGGALSKIKVTADSISLSVSNGALGSKASIVLSVNGATQTKQLDLSGVRNAFKNDTTAITISAGTVTFNSNTFVVNSTNFSVTATGVITAKSGTIGGLTLGSNALYNGKTSLTSDVYGIYLSGSGLSVGNGSTFTTVSNGHVYGGKNGSTTGYVSFNNYWTPTKVYGLRLAGNGCIALLTNGSFGIGGYKSFGKEATITVGQSGSITLVGNLKASWTRQSLTGTYNVSNLCKDLSISWTNYTLTFTKGLMVTSL